MKYDCIIIGAGPAGIYAAYEFMKKSPNLNILLIDKGYDIHERQKFVPGKTKIDVANHQKYSITNGFGGSGAYSDGKFNITAEFGGWLTDYLDSSTVYDLINYVDSINLRFGAPLNITDPTTDAVKVIEKKGIAVGLKLLKAKVRHLGTDLNLQILTSLYEELSKNITMKFNTKVIDIIEADSKISGVLLEDGSIIHSKYVFATIGREGAIWLSDLCKKHGLEMTTNQVDIGVRVETNNIIMEEINDHLYEGKFVYNTSVGTVVRTFCSNPSGHVVVEDAGSTKLVNGHAYNDKKLGTDNTNFALLVSHRFNEPFNRPNDYANDIAKLANELSCGTVIVQRYGDIIRGRRTTEKRLNEGFVKPSLKSAIPGDLGLVLPYNTMKSIIEMLEALNYVTPGIANEHTLLYGVETKFYSARPVINSNFETKLINFYVGGDGAGITRGLAQAAANGVYVARKIIELEENKRE